MGLSLSLSLSLFIQVHVLTPPVGGIIIWGYEINEQKLKLGQYEVEPLMYCAKWNALYGTCCMRYVSKYKI